MQYKIAAIINVHFMRIDYETEEIKQENQQISRQRLWLLIVSGGLLFTLFFKFLR